ncbi:MAG TPA: hypothetical protein VH851_08250, partial [Candidatus Binatia bacterium]
WISGVIYFDGWSKAQETRQGRRNFLWSDRLLNGVTQIFPGHIGAIMIKDIKTFMRDTTQWSQLFLLLALIVVYLYNFKVLPLERSPMPAGILRIVVSFANLALAGFVLSAVAVRFAFPAVSLEGRAFWILQSAPVSLRALVWSKFWLVFVPLLLLGELLIFLSNLLLHVPSWMMAISLVTIFLMTFGITAIGIGLGALYPNFNYENAAEIPTSFGGAIAMILSVAFIAVAVIIEAWPVYQLTIASLRYARIAAPTAGVLAPTLIAVALLTAAVVIVSLRIGIKRLEQLRD